ncbi:hypothetical protein EKO27_g11437 [Xylaria grammica]|uniref:Uncharacterized protein n=1 Tax=Xylaria grammica TaxID=363999 RepID=A0A439CND3_9PEZI|nr:hypothetical protein EKO27_g11437 [Xylaria grammica]
MDTKASNTPVSKSDWPAGNIYIEPVLLKELQERLERIQHKFQTAVKAVDPAVGLDLEWLAIHVCDPAYWVVWYVAGEAPPMDAPAGPDLIASSNALASQVEALTGNAEKIDLILPEIEALPDPEWDAVFKGFCQLLEASVDAHVLGDSPFYQAELAGRGEPHPIFRTIRNLLNDLGAFPFLRNYHSKLMRKLDGSRSGVIYKEYYWILDSSQKSDTTAKRKLGAINSDNSDSSESTSAEEGTHKLPRLESTDIPRTSRRSRR